MSMKSNNDFRVCPHCNTVLTQHREQEEKYYIDRYYKCGRCNYQKHSKETMVLEEIGKDASHWGVWKLPARPDWIEPVINSRQRQRMSWFSSERRQKCGT